jgi:hypothetical protein
MKGTLKQVIQYATKDQDFVFRFIRPFDNELQTILHQLSSTFTQPIDTTIQKTRQELRYQEFLDRLNQGYQKSQTIDEFPDLYVRHRYLAETIITRLQLIHADHTYNGKLTCKNFWLHGPPGVGKTSLVYKISHQMSLPIYNKLINKWWDGYEPEIHQIVLINDWTPGHDLTASSLCQWADRYAVQLEIKGGSQLIAPSCFYLFVTSNFTILGNALKLMI